MYSNIYSNCLRNNHNDYSYQIIIRCKICSSSHYYIVHKLNFKDQINADLRLSVSNTRQNTNLVKNCNILPSTAHINVKFSVGKVIHCKTLTDNASQSTSSNKRGRILNLPLVSSTHWLVIITGMLSET